MADKRDIMRLKKRLSLRFGTDEATRVAFSEDISRTGMFIKTANIYPPNTRIKLELDLSGNTVKMEARVMWAKKVPQNLFHLVKKSGMGIRFLKIVSGEDHLNRYFDELPGNGAPARATEGLL
jgi:Tfp pilus assembly protein PilZ